MEKYFGLQEHGTTVRTEVMAGITTFFTMAYILIVNPSILSAGAAIVGGDAAKIYNGVFFATCLASFFGTFLMAVYAKIPFAQAPGMGLNAFFAFTVIAGYGYAYNQALGLVFISGILFMVICLTGLKEQIVGSIPQSIKTAISVGIGIFIAFLGLQNSGLVVKNDATLVSLVNFSAYHDPEKRVAVAGAVLAVIGLVLIMVLSAKKVKGAMLIGIIGTTIIGIPMGVTQLPAEFAINFGAQFADYKEVSLFAFAGGLGDIFTGRGLLNSLFTLATLIICFSLVDIFDTIGGLIGTAKQAGLLKADGTMENMDKALLSDAAATTVGAMLGTSTVTTYVESAAGIGEGGRTGLTSLTTSVLFLLAIVAAPFVGSIPLQATAPALIYVGYLMLSSVAEIDWKDMSVALPAFLTIIIMPLTYSIANGIAFGLISHVIIKLFTGQASQIKIASVVLSVIFITRFFLIGM